MPSFDVISEVDKHELTNAVDQANRELTSRFDFKGSDAKFELDKFEITQSAPSEFQLQQMLDILRWTYPIRKPILVAPARRSPSSRVSNRRWQRSWSPH
jgi:cyclic-di-GMP-binding protein